MKKAFVILAATLSMSGAFAQTAASTPVAAAASGADVRAAQHQQRVEERIAYLHSALKITPEQEPQWKAFADTMRGNGETMATLYKQRADSETSRNALDDMKQYAQISQAHADDMQKLVTAFEPLYTSLSPEQKKLADTTFRHHGPTPGVKGPAHGKHKGKPKSKAPAAAASGAEAASAPAAE